MQIIKYLTTPSPLKYVYNSTTACNLFRKWNSHLEAVFLQKDWIVTHCRCWIWAVYIHK